MATGPEGPVELGTAELETAPVLARGGDAGVSEVRGEDELAGAVAEGATPDTATGEGWGPAPARGVDGSVTFSAGSGARAGGAVVASPARSAMRSPEWIGADGGTERRSFEADVGTESVVPIGPPPLAGRAPLRASRALLAVCSAPAVDVGAELGVEAALAVEARAPLAAALGAAAGGVLAETTFAVGLLRAALLAGESVCMRTTWDVGGSACVFSSKKGSAGAGGRVPVDEPGRGGAVAGASVVAAARGAWCSSATRATPPGGERSASRSTSAGDVRAACAAEIPLGLAASGSTPLATRGSATFETASWVAALESAASRATALDVAASWGAALATALGEAAGSLAPAASSAAALAAVSALRSAASRRRAAGIVSASRSRASGVLVPSADGTVRTPTAAVAAALLRFASEPRARAGLGTVGDAAVRALGGADGGA